METEKQLDEDLKKAELKKDKALAEKPNVFKQIKIGLDYRADQGLAIGKDKIKKATKKVTSKITNDDNSVIWWSNAFHTVNAQYVRGLQGVKDCYNVWLDQINKRNSNIWILGKDYLDRPVEGNTLKEYLNEYHV